MTQSGYIAGALLLGFVVYLAAKNRLGVYAGVLWGAGGSAGTAGGNSLLVQPPAGSPNNSVLGVQLPSWASTILNWTPTIAEGVGLP